MGYATFRYDAVKAENNFKRNSSGRTRKCKYPPPFPQLTLRCRPLSRAHTMQFQSAILLIDPHADVISLHNCLILPDFNRLTKIA